MRVELAMVKGDGTQRNFLLSRERLVIGRLNTCDLRIALPSVSRQHCEIVLDGAAVKLRDLGSSNGTYHNHTRVQEAVLSAGDEIGVGPVVFRVLIDGLPAPEPDSAKAAAKTAIQPAVAAPKPAPQAPKPAAAQSPEEALAAMDDSSQGSSMGLLEDSAGPLGKPDEDDDLPVLLDGQADQVPPGSKGKAKAD
jgi:predicted component of type VI protein secretion system